MEAALMLCATIFCQLTIYPALLVHLGHSLINRLNAAFRLDLPSSVDDLLHGFPDRHRDSALVLK